MICSGDSNPDDRSRQKRSSSQRKCKYFLRCKNSQFSFSEFDHIIGRIWRLISSLIFLLFHEKYQAHLIEFWMRSDTVTAMNILLIRVFFLRFCSTAQRLIKKGHSFETVSEIALCLNLSTKYFYLIIQVKFDEKLQNNPKK